MEEDDDMEVVTEVEPPTSTSEFLQAAFQIAEAPVEDTRRILTGLFGLNIATFDNLYRLDAKLRSGSFGTVYECEHVNYPGQLYAVKIIDRSKLKPKDDKAVFTEVATLRELHTVDNVIKIIDFFVQPDKLYVVQMLARGGDVFDRLTQRSKYNEFDARNLAVTLVTTIAEIHKRGIVHRDLKPENLLLKEERNDTGILVADFGFAKKLARGQFLKTRCGKLSYFFMLRCSGRLHH